MQIFPAAHSPGRPHWTARSLEKQIRFGDQARGAWSRHAGDAARPRHADNPSKVDVVTVTEAQKGQLQIEGMTLNSNLAVNGRAMISVLSILVHNGTHIDAPRHMMEKGSPIDQMPLGQLAKEGALINLPNKGPNSVVTVKDIEDSGVELGPDRIPIIHTGFTEKHARGAPHSGLSTLMRRISARSSASICGRPPTDRDFHRQYRRKPALCQRTRVSGRMIVMVLRTDGNLPTR
jgi:Putative cyclase